LRQWPLYLLRWQLLAHIQQRHQLRLQLTWHQLQLNLDHLQAHYYQSQHVAVTLPAFARA
jgi:hypothetical protein